MANPCFRYHIILWGPAVRGIITSSEVQLFKKSIVKSHADFPDFNGHVSKWNITKQNYKAVAANHGISRILDDSPVPPLGSRDRELFDLQNRYFYNILKVKVKAGKAKVIVNQHAIDLDGRRAWRKFIDYYEQKGIVSLNKAHFFEKLSSMRLSVNYRGGPNKFLTDFETVITDMENTTGEEMLDSDKVGFLTTAITDYQPFSSIKASLDTNALMTKQDITYDGMLQVLYNNCPSATKLQRSMNSLNSSPRSKSESAWKKDKPESAWKKDFTKWVPHKIFKTLPESEQKARREAIAKAKKAKRNANINATQIVPSDPESNTMTVPADLAPTFREIMSAAKIDKKTSADGDTWLRIVKPCRVVKNVHALTTSFGGLVDSGANTSLQGGDMRILHQEQGSVAIVGPSDGVENGMNDLSLVTCGGVAKTSLGEEVLVVITSAAAYGKGKSIISKFQLEQYGCTVNDRARVLGGHQIITTPEGDIFKLRLHSGLLYLPLRYPTVNDIETLRHVPLTSEGEQWNPDVYNDRDEDEKWYENKDSFEPDELNNHDYLDSRDGSVLETNFSTHDDSSIERVLCGVTGKRKPIDFYKLRPYFLWKPIDTIKKTFAVTTQFMETVWYNTPRLPLRRHYKSRAPFMNVRRLNEGYATDTIFSNCKAHDGSSCAQVYVGCTSKFVYIEGMSAKSQMPRTLLNFIRQWGAMKFLWRDMAKEENSKTVNDLLRSIHAPNRYSEPYNEHQNPAERRILDIKSGTRTVLDRTDTPDRWWLLCMTYVTYIINYIALPSLDWHTPYPLDIIRLR